ncbi:MAG: hypothetical protein NT140_13275 [Deltaproteobacteria bacterium]|nr:hypothetical protein [Deltaproteobacteria bacterium]
MIESQGELKRIDVPSFVKAMTFFSIVIGLIVIVLNVLYSITFDAPVLFWMDKLSVIEAIILIIAGPAIIGFDVAIVSFISCLIFNYSLKICGGIKFQI